MCKANLEKLSSFISFHLNEPRTIAEWRHEFNDFQNNNTMRLTDKEIAFAFRLLRDKGKFGVDKKSNLYCFLTPSGQEQSTVHNQEL